MGWEGLSPAEVGADYGLTTEDASAAIRGEMRHGTDLANYGDSDWLRENVLGELAKSPSAS